MVMVMGRVSKRRRLKIMKDRGREEMERRIRHEKKALLPEGVES